MSNHDFAVSNVGYTPHAPPKLNYTPHVIHLVDGKKTIKFITTNKMDLSNGYVAAKGLFTDASDEEISSKYMQMTEEVEKEKIVDILFPNHRILYIQSLIYTARK